MVLRQQEEKSGQIRKNVRQAKYHIKTCEFHNNISLEVLFIKSYWNAAPEIAILIWKVIVLSTAGRI